MAVKKLCARRICSPGDTRHAGFGDASARKGAIIHEALAPLHVCLVFAVDVGDDEKA